MMMMRRDSERVVFLGSPNISTKTLFATHTDRRRATSSLEADENSSFQSRNMRDDELLPLSLREDRMIQLILSTDTDGSNPALKGEPALYFKTESDGNADDVRQDENEASVAASSLDRDSLAFQGSSQETDSIGFEVDIDPGVLRINTDQDSFEVDASPGNTVCTSSASVDKSEERRKRLLKLGKRRSMASRSPSSHCSSDYKHGESSPRLSSAVDRKFKEKQFKDKTNTRSTGIGVQASLLIMSGPGPRAGIEKQPLPSYMDDTRGKPKSASPSSYSGCGKEALQKAQSDGASNENSSTGAPPRLSHTISDQREDISTGRKDQGNETKTVIHGGVPNEVGTSRNGTGTAPRSKGLRDFHYEKELESSRKSPASLKNPAPPLPSNDSSSFADTTDSSDIDGRLERLKAQILHDGDQSVATIESSVDGRWERLRNKLLNEEQNAGIDLNEQSMKSSASGKPPSFPVQKLSSSTGSREESQDGNIQDDDMSEDLSQRLETVSEEEKESALLSNTGITRCRTEWSDRTGPSSKFRDLNRVQSCGNVPAGRNPKSKTEGFSRWDEVHSKESFSKLGTEKLLDTKLRMVDVTPCKHQNSRVDSGNESKDEFQTGAGNLKSSQGKQNRLSNAEGRKCVRNTSMSPITVDGEERQRLDRKLSSIGGSNEGSKMEDMLASFSGTDDQEHRSTPVPMLGNVLSELSESCGSQRTHEKMEKMKLPSLQKSITGSTTPEEESATLTPTSNRATNSTDQGVHGYSEERGPKIEVTLLPMAVTPSPKPGANHSAPSDRKATEKAKKKPTPLSIATNGTAGNGNKVGEAAVGRRSSPRSTNNDRAILKPKRSLKETNAAGAGSSSEQAQETISIQNKPSNAYSVGASLFDVMLATSASSSCGSTNEPNLKTEEDLTPAYSVDYKSVGSFDGAGDKSWSEGKPSWRLDPQESLSDWTIEVEHLKSGAVDIYHVHRHAVAVGPRKSEYLADVFSGEEGKTTRIPMEDASARHFPLLLDFIYSHHMEIEVTSKNSIPLRYLAKILKVYPLAKQVAEFVRGDLVISNMSVYITNAATYKDTKILKLVADTCAKQVKEIEVSHPLWAVMDPKMFLRVLSSRLVGDRVAVSPQLSLLIAEYHSLHKYEIDAETFEAFTSEDIIPLMDRKAALLLIEISEQYGIEDKFIPLQTRCTHVLAYHWTVTNGADRGRLFAVLRSLPSHFTVDFLELVETGRSATLINALKLNKKQGGDMESGNLGASSSISESSLSLGNSAEPQAIDMGISRDEYEESPLSWRLNPKASFSDWQLEVKNLQYGAGEIYHIHKQILAVGPRKSKFFSTLFQSRSGQKKEPYKTTIALGYTAAALVPQVLDFMYSPENDLEICTETAVTLRFLARYFQILLLNEKILEFVTRDISLDNVTTYISYCNTFNDVKIAEIATTLCAQQIRDIHENSDVLRNMDAKFFVRVASSKEVDRATSSCHLSVLIAKYHSIHKLDESVLESIVGESQIPEIDCKSALKLLQIVDKLKNKKNETFSNLCKRCVHVLTFYWADFRDKHRGEIFSVFRNLDSGLVTDLFDKIEGDYHKQNYDIMSVQSKLVKRYRKQLADSTQQHIDELASLKTERDETVDVLKRQVMALENQLKRHNDASNRRVGRSSSAFPSRIPSPRNSSIRSPPASPMTLSCIPVIAMSPSSCGSRTPTALGLPRTPSNLGFSSPRGGSKSKPGNKIPTPRSSNSSTMVSPKASHSSKIPTPKAKPATPSSTTSAQKKEAPSFFGFSGFSDYLKTHTSIALAPPNTIKKSMTFS